MKSKKCFGAGLCSGALYGALVVLGLSGCGDLRSPARTTTEELVMRFQFEENTKELKASFEDGARHELKTFELKNPSNPLGELAGGGTTEALTHALVFAVRKSPGCLYGCAGKFCGSTC